MFNAARAWRETSPFAPVPANFLYKFGGDKNVSIFKKIGLFTCGTLVKFSDPGNLPYW